MLTFAERVDHMAYVTFDMRATAAFWNGVMGAPLVAHVYGDLVPSTREPHPYLHLFFRLGDESDIAFFEVRGLERAPQEVGVCSELPRLSLEVDSEAELARYRERLDAAGVDVSGPERDAFGTFVTFRDPNEICVEIRVATPTGDAERARRAVADWSAERHSLVRG